MFAHRTVYRLWSNAADEEERRRGIEPPSLKNMLKAIGYGVGAESGVYGPARNQAC